MDQRRCVHCRTRFIPLRNPDQRYCSKPSCRRKRRCKYQKTKLTQDCDYKETHQVSQQKWRYKHPDYWCQYRLQHPIYVTNNRTAQVKRDQKRRKCGQKNTPISVLANMYSLIPKNNYFSCDYKIILGSICGVSTCLQICTL
jgi:hypothetical protein